MLRLQVLPDLDMASLDKVITQGMNQKKKHEVGPEFVELKFYALPTIDLRLYYYTG